MDYKDTLNLPRTDFPMKADLVAPKPSRLERWRKDGLYARIQQKSQGAEKLVLHELRHARLLFPTMPAYPTLRHSFVSGRLPSAFAAVASGRNRVSGLLSKATKP